MSTSATIQLSLYPPIILNPFPNDNILEWSKLKGFADDNFEFDENGRKFSKRVEKHCGERRYCLLQAISPFPTMFSKTCRLFDTQKARLIWERVLDVPSFVLRIFQHLYSQSEFVLLFNFTKS